MNIISKIYENILSFVYLFQLNSHDLCDAKIYKLQNKKIKKLMKKAYKIPFYRQKFEKVGLKPEDFRTREDLAKFPVLTKQEIKDWITPQVSKLQNKFHVVSTSGSTGTPLLTLVSPRENAYLTANWLRIAMKNGVNPFFQKTMALKDPKIVAQGSDSLIQKMGILRRKKLSFLAEGKTLVEEMNLYQPNFFYVHKTKLMQMIEYAQKNDVSLYHPDVYAVISEMISPDDEKMFRENMGENIFTSYGCMETGACTFTPKGTLDKHIITNDTHVINVVAENNKCSSSGKMLLTNLNFLHFPIINYDVGDDADVYSESGVEYIQLIHGRVNDWIILEDGRRYDYHPFYRAFEGQEEVRHFRVIQDTHHSVTIQLVEKKKLTFEQKQHIEQEICAQLDAVIVESGILYSFEWKDSIEADKNGKTRFIVNRISE